MLFVLAHVPLATVLGGANVLSVLAETVGARDSTQKGTVLTTAYPHTDCGKMAATLGRRRRCDRVVWWHTHRFVWPACPASALECG